MKPVIFFAVLACAAPCFAQADLSGVWNKNLVANTSRGVEPLPFTPEGLKAFNDVWNHIDPTSRCIFPGVPRVNTSPYPFQIVQTPDKVIFLYEYMHNFRVIYIDGRGHRPSWEPSLLGDSIGKWDADTLVIDTVNLTDRTWLDDHGDRHSDQLHVIERWRRVNANTLHYEETIDDPKFYTKPWTALILSLRLQSPKFDIREMECSPTETALYNKLFANPAAGIEP
jgi:hypothetical protein